MNDPRLQIHAEFATVAVGRLREAWPWLTALVEPGRARRVQHRLSPQQRAELNRLVLAERADRAKLARDGLTPQPPTPVPVGVRVVDTQITIQNTVEDTCWRVTEALRHRRGMGFALTGRTGDERVTAALDYLAAMLRHVPDLGCVTDAAVRLDTADRIARRTAQVDSDRRQLNAECPACGRRSLCAETGSPNYREWAILCSRDDCRCRGVTCGCKRPGRQPQVRHIWPEREWEQLAVLLTAGEAS